MFRKSWTIYYNKTLRFTDFDLSDTVYWVGYHCDDWVVLLFIYIPLDSIMYCGQHRSVRTLDFSFTSVFCRLYYGTCKDTSWYFCRFFDWYWLYGRPDGYSWESREKVGTFETTLFSSLGGGCNQSKFPLHLGGTKSQSYDQRTRWETPSQGERECRRTYTTYIAVLTTKYFRNLVLKRL